MVCHFLPFAKVGQNWLNLMFVNSTPWFKGHNTEDKIKCSCISSIPFIIPSPAASSELDKLLASLWTPLSPLPAQRRTASGCRQGPIFTLRRPGRASSPSSPCLKDKEDKLMARQGQTLDKSAASLAQVEEFDDDDDDDDEKTLEMNPHDWGCGKWKWRCKERRQSVCKGFIKGKSSGHWDLVFRGRLPG